MDIETTGPAVDINDTGGGDPEINFQISGTTTFSIGIDNSDSDKLKIGTTAPDASTSVTIDASQNVGIQNSSPDALLEVGSNSSADGDFLLMISGDRSWSFVQRGEDENANLALYTHADDKSFQIQSQDATDVAEFFTSNTDASCRAYLVPDGGRVGIGTTSASATLDVDGSAIFNESGAAVDFRVEGDTEANLLFVDASADRVGVGTATPATTLDVDGGLFVSNSRLVESGGTTFLQVGAARTTGSAQDFFIGDMYEATTVSDRKFMIKAGGNVGIGTVAPNTTLHLENTDATANAVEDMLTLTKETSGTPAAGIGVGIVFEIEDGLTVAEEQGRINVELDDVTEGAEDATMTFDINQNGTMTEIMRIEGTSGNVGIGTSSPSYTLDVNGTVQVYASSSGGSVMKWKSSDGARGFDLSVPPDGDLASPFIYSTGNAWRWTVDDINTLDINSNGLVTINEDGTSDQDFRVEGDTDTELLFIDASTDRVGISTTSPTHKLQVLGEACIGPTDMYESVLLGEHEIKLTNTGAAHFSFVNTNTNQLQVQNTSSNAPLGTAASNVIMTFASGGDVGIGMTNPSVELDVTGDIEYTGTITDVSDRRLKENFSSIDSVLTKIMKIKGLSYNMINDSLKTREYGVIAQDVQAVFPEIVTTVDPENGYLGVAYIQLIPVLLEATKEQQAIIEAQKKEIETQKAELDSKTSTNAEEIEALKAQVQQLLQLIQQQESVSIEE